jgi:hypothetical protein
MQSRPSITNLSFLLLLASAGCDDSTPDEREADGGQQMHADAGDRDAALRDDAGRRIKPRTVGIDLARIATREVTKGDHGEPVFGPIKPLEGADVCVLQQRKAFDVFKPFKPLDEPICAKSVADEIVHIDGVPANSDLVITIEYKGLQPAQLTERTNDYDVTGPGWAANYYAVLVKPGAVDPWIEPKPGPSAHDGLVWIAAAILWTGDGAARPEVLKGTDTLAGQFDSIATAEGMAISVTPPGADKAIEVETHTQLSFFSLPEGSARIAFKNENSRLSCASSGGGGGGELTGLPAAASATFDVPVLEGHTQLAAVLCTCANQPGDGELIDLATCTFANADTDAGTDADGGTP